MAQLVYPICSSWIGEIVKALANGANAAFGLTTGLVVVGGGHFKLNLKVLYELLSEVRGELTVSVRDNREGISMNSEYLVQKNLGSLLNIDILGNWEQVCVATEVIKNYQNEIAFLVAR
jgi:hypothetical protein